RWYVLSEVAPRIFGGDVCGTGARCDDDRVTRRWQIIVVTLAAVAAMGAMVPSSNVAATAPPTTETPVVTNDLLPQNNDVSNCVGTVESANCGSKARAD